MSFGNVNDCLNVILFYFNISIDLCSKYRVKSFFNLEPELCIAYRMPYISVVNLLYKIILFIFCYLPLSLLAQDDLPIELINQIESYLEDSDDVEINIDDLITTFKGYYSSPIDLNTITSEDLLQLQLLDEFKINAFLDYRAANGPLLRKEELQVIDGWTVADAKFLGSLSSVKQEYTYQLSPFQMAIQGKHELYLKWKKVLEQQRGYDPESTSRYLGDNNGLSVRYRYNYENKLKYGFILEKDAGEEFFKGSNKHGFDYFSAHFYLKDYSKLLKDLAIGDYTISMGQGLISHNDFGAGKSSWVTDIKLGGRPIKAYNSVAENFYNRGVAVRLQLVDNLEVTLFGSFAEKDGNVTLVDTSDIDDPDVRFSSFLASGFHRTEGENAKENAVEELKYGGIIKYGGSHWHIAGNVQHQSYSAAIESSTQLYNLYRFAGDKLTNTSIDYGYRYRNLSFFGEVAHSFPGGFAQLHGLLLGLDRHVSLSLLYRNYTPQYNAILPNAFGESATVKNEEGIYLGLQVSPTRRWKIRLYADMWQNPWLRFQTDAPSTGREFLARVDYTIKRKLNIYFQYFNETKYSNFGDAKIDTPQLQNRQRFRFHISQKLTKAVELRTRTEFSLFDQGIKSRGFAIMQDIIFKPINFPVSLTTRIALFDTDDFDSRIYAYENDILYEFYIPAYFYQGMRYYINLRCKVTRNLTAEMRYAHTRYTNRDEIGSGLDLISGDRRNDVKAQLRLKF